MGATARYEAPHAQLCQLATEAIRRGEDFEVFWQRAVRPGEPLVRMKHPNPPASAVRWPTDYYEADAWYEAITGSKDGWRRAYEREPAPSCEAALVFLANEGLFDVPPNSGVDEDAVGIAA